MLHKSLRKGLFPVLLLLLALTVAACGGGSDEPATDAAPTENTAETSTSAPVEDTEYVLSGTVVDIDDRGIPGVEIMFSPWTDPEETDQHGHWTKSDLSGSVTIFAYHNDYEFEPESIQVDRADTDIHFVGTPLGCIPTTPCKIADIEDLQNIRDDVEGHYVLTNDIDATATATWNDGKGFEPIGLQYEPFSGHLNGNGYEIKGLVINRPTEREVALFARVGQGGVIENIGLVEGNIVGLGDVASLVAVNEGTIRTSYNGNDVSSTDEYGVVGGLVARHRTEHALITDSYNKGTITAAGSTAGGVVGDSTGGTIRHVYNEGTVTGPGDHIGGVLADNSHGIVEHAYNTGFVSGGGTVGGVAASNSRNAHIRHSYNLGTVEATGNNVGGALGHNNGGLVEYVFNRGNVTSSGTSVGGVVGANGGGGTIAYVFNTGNVASNAANVGGVVGRNSSAFYEDEMNTVSNVYNTGHVKGTSAVGGLVGEQYASAAIENSYSTGTIEVVDGHWDVPTVGGLIGSFENERGVDNTDSIKASFYDSAYYSEGATAITYNDDGTAKTDDQLKQKATFVDAGWDFDAVWTIDDGQDYPDLVDNPR